MHHCGRFAPRPLTRRDLLARCGGGFGALALTALMNQWAGATPGAIPGPGQTTPRAAGTKSLTHLVPRARNVIFLYMDGGPSQVDTFDYKPALARYHGQEPHKAMGKLEPTQFASVGKVMQSPWAFKRYGQSGQWVSELFPHVATVIDELTIVRSMTSEFSEHTNANYFLHTGSGLQGRPSMGAWATYGLGSDCQNLPGFIVLDGGLIPPGGLDNFNSGFLPATYQGSIFKPSMTGVANARPTESRAEIQQRKLALMRDLDAEAASQTGHVDAIESAISNYELAYSMQAAVPELMDLTGESSATRELYGLNNPHSAIFGSECLLARRMVERGVRFVELTCPSVSGDRWDQHGDLRTGHAHNALAVDQPCAALIKDLKSRGLLDSTLVVWAGEFGRTPFAQGADGRDHNPFGFTVWMAGGGLKPGFAYGETDDFGYKSVVNRCGIHDLHATILYQLGIDHTRLTYRYSGRDMRLTDVYGEVLHDLIA